MQTGLPAGLTAHLFLTFRTRISSIKAFSVLVFIVLEETKRVFINKRYRWILNWFRREFFCNHTVILQVRRTMSHFFWYQYCYIYCSTFINTTSSFRRICLITLTDLAVYVNPEVKLNLRYSLCIKDEVGNKAGY